MSVKIPGLFFTLQAIDHSRVGDENGLTTCSSLINSNEQVHAGWYGGGDDLVENHMKGVIPGCHYVIVVYSTDLVTLGEVRSNNYRFTLDNQWSNTGSYDSNNYYQFTNHVTQIADGEFMQLDGAFNNSSHYLRDHNSNPDYGNNNINGSPGGQPTKPFPTANYWAVIPPDTGNHFWNLNYPTLDDDRIDADVNINLFTKAMFGKYSQEFNSGSTSDYSGSELTAYRKQIFITKTPCLAQSIDGMAGSGLSTSAKMAYLDKAFCSFNLKIEHWNGSSWVDLGTIDNVIRTRGSSLFPQNYGGASTTSGGFWSSGLFDASSWNGGLSGALSVECRCINSASNPVQLSCDSTEWKLTQGHIYAPHNNGTMLGEDHIIDYKVDYSGTYTSFGPSSTNLIPWYINKVDPGTQAGITPTPYTKNVFDNIFVYDVTGVAFIFPDAYSIIPSYESNLHICLTEWPGQPNTASNVYNYGVLGAPGGFPYPNLWKSLHKNSTPGTIPYTYFPANCIGACGPGGSNTMNYLDPDLYAFSFEYMNKEREGSPPANGYTISDSQYTETGGDRGGYYGTYPITTGNFNEFDTETQITGFVYNAPACPSSETWLNIMSFQGTSPGIWALQLNTSSACGGPTLLPSPDNHGAFIYTYDGSLGPTLEIRRDDSGVPDFTGPGLIQTVNYTGTNVTVEILASDIVSANVAYGDKDYEYWFVVPSTGCMYYVEQYLPAVATLDCDRVPIVEGQINCTNASGSCSSSVPATLQFQSGFITSSTIWTAPGILMNGGTQGTGCESTSSNFQVEIEYRVWNVSTFAVYTLGYETIDMTTTDCGGGVTHKSSVGGTFSLAAFASAGNLIKPVVKVRGYEGNNYWPGYPQGNSGWTDQGQKIWNDSFVVPGVVTNDLALLHPPGLVTQSRCADDTGKIMVMVDGMGGPGTPPYIVDLISVGGATANNSFWTFQLILGEWIASPTSFTGTVLLTDIKANHTYKVRVTDDDGCCVEETVVMTGVENVTINSLTSTDPTTCSGVNGTITSNVSTTCSTGSTITYLWSGSNGGIVPAGQVSAANPVGLTAGDYSLQVTDQCGCIDTSTITLGSGGGLWNLGFSNIHPLECDLCLGVIGIYINEPTLLTGSGSYTIDSCTNCGVTGSNLPITFNIPTSTATAWFFESALLGATNVAGAAICVDSGSSPGLPSVYTITFDDGTGCTQTWDTNLYSSGSHTLSPATITCVGCIGATCSITGPVAVIPPSPYNSSCHVRYDYWISETDYYLSGNETNVTGPQTSMTFTGLVAGVTYYITVVDIITTNCTNHNDLSSHFVACIMENGTYTGTSTATLSASLAYTSPPCFNAGNGTVQLSASYTGGVVPYTFQFTLSDGSVVSWQSGNQTGFPVNTACNFGTLQSVEVMDGNGCTATASVNVPCLPASLTLPVIVTIVDATCTNPQVANGSLTHSAAQGGTPPYTYQWYTNVGLTTAATGTGNNSLAYTAVLPGNYWMEVTDANGCQTSSGPHTVAQDICDLCLTYTKTDITCGGANGTIDLTVDGANICGTAGHSFTYAWTGPGGFTATTQDLTGLSTSGNYIVTVTDTTTGETDSLTIFIGGGTDIAETLTLTSVEPDCAGACDGKIGVQCLAGDFPLNIRVSTIYSGVGDLLVANYVTVQGGPFSALQMGGGAPYLWLCPDAGCDATQHSGSANFHGTSGVTNFCFVEGTTYYFQSVGANTCLSGVFSIVQATHVPTPIVLTETIIQPTCCDCTNSGCATCNCNGSIIVIATGGNTNPPLDPWSSILFEYDEFSNGTFIDITADFTQTVNYLVTGIFVFDVISNINSLGLYPGTYRLTVTDGCGVSTTETYIINDPKVYIAQITTTDLTCLNGCQDGSITVEAYGGDSGFLQFSNDGGLTWSVPIATGILIINGVSYTNAAAITFTLLLPGAYDIWVRDTSPCNPPTYADPNDVSLCASGCFGCYADYIYANHHVVLSALSMLSASVVSFNNITLIGGSDGEIGISITGGVEPYDISISCHTSITGYANCVNQGLPIPAGLSQFINLNTVNIDASGITGAQDAGSSLGQAVTLNSGGGLIFDNLSLANDLSPLSITGNYRIIIQDAEGCLAVLNQELENGLRNYLNLYGAEDCNCNCPPGYVYQDPDGIPNSGDENCDGEASIQPDYNGSVGTIGSIRQFIAPGNLPGSIVALYSTSIPAWYTDASLLPITILLGNTFYIHDVSGVIQFDNSAGDVLTPGPLSFPGNIFTVGGTGYGRLWDNGIWLSGQALFPVAIPEDEWLYIIIEVAFTTPIQTILAVACDGMWTFDINCNSVITNQNVGGSQNILEERQGYTQYSLFTLGLQQGQYTLKFGVKNSSVGIVPTNTSAPAGISFDLFQGFTSGGIDVLTILAAANIGDDIDQYLIDDINNVPISSKSHGPIYSDNLTGLDVANPYFNTMGSVTGQLYGQFLSSINHISPTGIYGHRCSTGCLRILNGELICVVTDDQDCVLPLDCGYCSDPVYVSQGPCEDAGGVWTTDDGILSDLVECIGTMTNILYGKLASGLLDNTLCIQDVWRVILIKYLIKNLNSCITAEDLVSWAKFLEDLCPDCDIKSIVSDIDEDITPTNSDFDF